MKFRYAGLAVIMMLSGCTHHQSEQKLNPGSGGNILYARGFSMEESGTGLRVRVTDPWQQAEGAAYTYVLSDTARESRVLGSAETLIKTPVRRVVCLSTTHIGFIGMLGKTATIAGVSGKDYVADAKLRYRIDAQSVVDVGYDENINYELIVSLEPDVVFAYGVTAMVTKTVAKLRELGIPVVLVAEYLEEDVLAKAEWVKFFAAFYGKNEAADSAFMQIADRYHALKEMTYGVRERPTVLMGLPWRGTWYVSGGRSYAARLISDAGADYIWSDLDFSDSRPVPLEKVYELALKADFWVNAGDAGSMGDIAAVDERFINLNAFREGTIYNNNKQLVPTGGNAYFENGVVEPHLILEDLISIFHPHLLPSHELVYYQKLQ